jgi:hypothetical protein
MSESGWATVDARARTAKRTAVAETKRGFKRLRERIRNAFTAARNITAKQQRRAVWARGWVHKQFRDREDRRQQAATFHVERAIESDIARLVSGTGPIIVGPWLSEVGYEVLYWVPFVRWVRSRYGVAADRLIVVTRGGAACWYADITTNAVELFDVMPPAEYAARNAERSSGEGGTIKQRTVSAMDRDIVAAAEERIGARGARLLHPLLMYQLFHQFWLGHRAPAFLDNHTRYARVAAPDVPLPPLPPRFTAVKFYTAVTLPPTPFIHRTVQSMVLALAQRTPVVMLDTGLTLDDHEDYSFELAARVHSLREHLDPRDNLAVQTAVIGRAESFVGTCGALAWLAPMLGVNTTAVFANPEFLHGHLQVARRVYANIGGGRFSPLDISALDQLGLSLTS